MHEPYARHALFMGTEEQNWVLKTIATKASHTIPTKKKIIEKTA